MRLIKISMELAFDNLEDSIDFSNKESIADYLTNMLHEDPDFFGGFGPENIEEVKELD